MKNKDNKFYFKLSTEEKQTLKEVATYFGMTMSKFLRMSITMAENMMLDEQLNKEMPFINNAVNQKAMHFFNNWIKKDLN